jgi:hypothetical protein
MPRHPELFAYNEAFVQRFIDPSMHHNAQKERPALLSAVREIAEQLYHFQLFTPAFCQCLIDEAEHHGKWETNLEKSFDPHPMFPDDPGMIDVCEPDTTISFDELPGLEDVYAQIIRQHVQPLVEALWITFKLQRWDVPEVRKYLPDLVNQMDLHYDLETVALVTYLSGPTFVGGGTHFPRWNVTVGNHENVRSGSAIVYPGGVSHEHSALPITAGVRYMLGGSLY